jgi:hypothetical protein
VTAGSGFGFAVSAEDGLGTVDTSFQGNVTVAISNDSIGGMVTVPAVNGVATFSGLFVDQAGYYTLSASSSGLAGATTNSFNVVAAAATQLVVSSPNGNVLAGAGFSLQVNADDPYGNQDSSFTGNVTIALGNNPGGSALGGTLTMPASYGSAYFSDLVINNLGSGYTIQATSAPLTSGFFRPDSESGRLLRVVRHRQRPGRDYSKFIQRQRRKRQPACADHTAAKQRHRRDGLRAGCFGRRYLRQC